MTTMSLPNRPHSKSSSTTTGVHGRPVKFAAVAVILAVSNAESGGDGWESNPPRTPQQRPADGFEDRGRHQSSFIPSLANPYFGCQHNKQGVRPMTKVDSAPGDHSP